MTTADPSTRRHSGRDPVPGAERATGVIDWPAVRRASQSCCCVARPAVVIVLQPTHERPHPTEVQLCAHHFARSRPTLLAGRALAFGLDAEHLPITGRRAAETGAAAAA